MTRDTWGTVQQDLLKAVGKNNYANWIEPIEFDMYEAGTVRLTVPTSFMCTWVSRHFGDQIRAQIERTGTAVDRLEFRVAASEATEAPRPKPQKSAQPVPSDIRPPAHTPARPGEAELPGAPLDKRFTFYTFVVGKPNELAYAAARRVAAGVDVTFNPLFLYGGVGLGKTHLMHAIAWEMRERNPGMRVLYLSAEQFMYRFVQALRVNGTLEFKALFRSVDVLMVDDVQFIAGKNSTQEEFFHTFNALIDQNKQIILSGDRAPTDIKKLEMRIASRLQSGLVVDLHPTDYELRLGILQSKAEQYRESYPGLVIKPGVLEFLAHRISTNVRVLEGALIKLFAFGSLVGREVSMEMTKDCLADILRASERKVSIEEIQRQVAEHFNVKLSDMLGPKRTRTISRPRQMAMYLSKHLTSRSLPEIGRRFGGRDHTTVIHAVRKVEALKATDTQIADDLELLRRILEA